MRRTLLAILLVTIVAAGTPAANEIVPFRLHRNHLVLVQGSTGSVSDLVLLIDTGAARTIVTKAVASSMGLKGTQTNLNAFGHPIAAEEVMLPALRIGARLVANPSVLVTELSGTAASLQLQRLDAIVGMDILRLSCFSIDFQRREMRFGAPTALPYRAPFVRQSVVPVIAAVADDTPVHLVVDTGASHLTLFGFRGGRPLVLKGDAVRLGGTATVKPVLVEYLQIGSWRRERVVALTMDRNPAESTGADGVLGLPALAASLVQFDFIANELGWKP